MSDPFLHQEALKYIEEYKKENFDKVYQRTKDGKLVLIPYSSVDLVMFVVKKLLKR